MGLVNRDAFAREELHKESVYGSCHFCGNHNRYGKVWRYWIERDDDLGNRKNYIPGKYCSKQCMEAYN